MDSLLLLVVKKAMGRTNQSVEKTACFLSRFDQFSKLLKFTALLTLSLFKINFFIVFEAEQKNNKLQGELRKMDSDFESELKERETIVDDLKKLETEKVHYSICLKYSMVCIERSGASPGGGEKGAS